MPLMCWIHLYSEKRKVLRSTEEEERWLSCLTQTRWSGMYVCVCVCVSVQRVVWVCMRPAVGRCQVCVCVCVSMSVYVCLCVCLCVCTASRLGLSMCVCLCVCTASRLGLYATGSRALSGEQIDSMDVTQLEKVINQICVFYRVSPRHKHKIVKVRYVYLLTYLRTCG